MSVFICWSGGRSHKLARAVEALLTTTLKLEPEDVFVSDRIDKGVAWFEAITERLEQSTVGIVCLTEENVASPWLHFEAGALALRLERRRKEEEEQPAPAGARPAPRNHLFTLLHGVTGAKLQGPLSAYQATSTTAPELALMMLRINEILGGGHLQAVAAGEQGEPAAATSDIPPIFRPDDWKKFKASLDDLAIPARVLIPELASWFQRKTFNEPLHCCADQAWLRRYDGASQTHKRLSDRLAQVRAACPEHESGLFEMLVTEVDGYAMTLAALLLTPRTFDLGDNGELKMDASIQRACEDRRLAIRSMAGRLLRAVDTSDGASGDQSLADLQSPDTPLLGKEAVRFMAAETDEERKMIIHHLESGIRSRWERVYQESGKGPSASDRWGPCIRELTRNRELLGFRASSWDLDRIYYYLLITYFGAAALQRQAAAEGAHPQDVMCAARDVKLEVERYRAKSKGGSLSPLTYALGSLQTLDEQMAPTPPEGAARAKDTVNSALDLVKLELGELLKQDSHRALRRIVEGIGSGYLAQRAAADGK